MQAAKKLISSHLTNLYRKEEIEGITRLIFGKVTGLTRLQVHLKQHEPISVANLTQIEEIITRLIQFEPIQYILGETEFYGLILKVTPDVLIPRPETEELVDWIIREHQNQHPSILDIGTGSGCIPITLVKYIPGASAEGWDISSAALKIANENAIANQVKINFQFADILKSIYPVAQKRFDLIISNPPYVTTSEKSVMLKNVIDYEPSIALFVPDDDPLVFYRKISDLALYLLEPAGKLYFEINEKYGDDTVQLLSSKGFCNIILRKDINSRERMIRAEKKN